MKRLRLTLRAALLATATAVVLSGCDTLQGVIDSKGVEYTQETLQTAEDTICRYAPVGGVVRRYDTAEKARAWVSLCLGSAPDGAPLVDALEDTGAFQEVAWGQRAMSDDIFLCVHGFGFDPADLKDGVPGKHHPEHRFGPDIRAALGVPEAELFMWYSVPPTVKGFARTWLCWPPYLHRYRHAWDLSAQAARGLAARIREVVRSGHTVRLVGHSLGTRVILFALTELKPADLAMVRGLLLLNGAALQRDAVHAMRLTGYLRWPHTLNIAVRTDDVLKRLGSRFVPGRGSCIGNSGLHQDFEAERWRDVYLDDFAFRARAAELRGWDLNGDKPDHIADHWWSYRNPDNATLLEAWADGDTFGDLLPEL